MQYRRRDSLVRLYELSPKTVDKYVKEMAMSNLYPVDFCLKRKGVTLVEEEAFRHYLRWADLLEGGRMVPQYQRAETPEDVYLIQWRETR